MKSLWPCANFKVLHIHYHSAQCYTSAQGASALWAQSHSGKLNFSVGQNI